MEEQNFDRLFNWCAENKTAIEKFQKELKRKQCTPYTDLIIEMKEAIEWYIDNCITIHNSRSYDETFYNLGTNLISRAEDLLEND